MKKGIYLAVLCAALCLAVVMAGACSSMNKRREFDLDKYTKEVEELMPMLIGELGLTWEQQGQVEEILLDVGERMAEMSQQGPPQRGERPGGESGPGGRGGTRGPGAGSMAEGMAGRVLEQIMPVLDKDQQKKADWIEGKLVELFKEVMPAMPSGRSMGGRSGGGRPR